MTLAACGADADDPARTALVGQADVERFRTEVFLETLDIDADLARLESEAGAADSVAQAAYAPVLERLREDRRRLQARLDSLRPAAPARFDSAKASIRAQSDRLRQTVTRAPFEAAPDVVSLRAAAARELARLDAALARLGPAAASDSTGRLQRGVDSLAADRGRLDARIGAFADTTAGAFPRFRTAVTDAALRLRQRLAALQPDSTATPAPTVR